MKLHFLLAAAAHVLPLVSAVLVASLIVLHRPQALGQEERNPSALFRSSVGTPQPNVMLSGHTPAREGHLTLFADFPATDAGGCSANSALEASREEN